jgi:FMN phosphatase YigB (HAD superfamily)
VPASFIQALALDLGNVLVQVDHLRFCRRLAALAGLGPEEVYLRIFQSELEPAYDTGRLTSEGFHQRLLEVFPVTLPFPVFSAWWNDIFSPMPEMEETVRKLAEHYPLYLASNTNPLHFTYIQERYAFLEVFQDFILSYEVGSRKPEPAFYQALIKRLGLPPSRCLFVDDKPAFVAAAQAHGLKAWQFTSPTAFTEMLQRHGWW